MATPSSCRRAAIGPIDMCKAVSVMAFILLLVPIVHAGCAELGYPKGACYNPLDTSCISGQPYDCDWKSWNLCWVRMSATCGSNQYCNDPFGPQEGAHCDTCSNECSTEGQKTCSGNGYKTCVKDFSKDNKCLKWSAVTTCSSSQYCSGGNCISCSNDCSSGQKRCSGSGYQTCGTDNNGCRIWGSTTGCGSDEKCSSGSCVKKCLPSNCRWDPATAIDEGGIATLKANFVGCGGKNVDVSIYDSDWPMGDADYAFPLAWSVSGDGTQTKAWTAQWSDDTDGSDIAPEYYFRIDTIDGSCSSGTDLIGTLWLRKVCSNPCAEGAKQCDGNGYKTCKKDKYGCTYWEKTADCASDQKCQDGNCVAKSCQELGHYDWCILIGNTECHNNNPFECRMISPLQWCYVKTGTCTSDEVCKDPFGMTGAHCEKKCVNECTSGQTRCTADGKGYRVCSAEWGGCWKWSTDSAACTPEQKCESGTCKAKTCKEIGYYDSCWLVGNTVCKENNPYKCKTITPTTWCLEKTATCTSNEACVDPFGLTGAHCEPTVINGCEVLSASWSAAKAEDGDKVMMSVTTTSGCDGKEANFRIYEDDLWPLEDDYTDYRTATVSGSKASTEWTAAWGPDCAIGNCSGSGFWAEAGDPEYYFTAIIGQNNKSSDNIDVEQKTVKTENLSIMLAANAPVDAACLNSTTLSQGCIERINSLSGNFTQSGEDEAEWDAVTAVWKTSCKGCAIGLTGVGLGLLACGTGFACPAGAALGTYTAPLMLGGCELCIGVGNLEVAIGSAKLGAVLAMRSAGVAKTIAEEEAILKANKAEIISVESSNTGGRIVAKIGGTIKEWWVVVTNTGNKIRKYYRTVVAGDIDAEAEDLAIKYMLDRPKATFPSGSKNALTTIFKLEKIEGLKIGAESDEAMTMALRYFRQEDQEKLPLMLKGAGLDPKNVRITFRTKITGSGGGEITGRTITSDNGITSIEISTGYLWDDFMKGALTEEKMATIMKHATLSHEAAHYPVDKALDAGIIGKYPKEYGEGFTEYVVDVMRYKIDPDAIAAVRLEIDEGLWLARKDKAMTNQYRYAFLRSDAIKAGRNDIVEIWDDELAARAQAKGMKPSEVLAEVYTFTQRIISDGDEVIELIVSQPKSQEIGSIFSSLFAKSFALVNIWDIINGKIPPEGDCICADVNDPVCGKDGRTYDNECEAKCGGTTVAYDSACVQPCTDECRYEGQNECAGSAIKRCVKGGSCLKWETWSKCQTSERCESGSCVKACADQCKPNQKRCGGSGYQSCDQVVDGCWRWGTTTGCGSAETCQDGRCIAKSCVAMGYEGFCMTPGNTECRNNNPYNCRIVSTSMWCLEKLDSCGGDEVCKDPFGAMGAYCAKKASDPVVIVTETKPKCYDKCSEGETQCKDNGIVSCARGADGCLDWAAMSSCGQNQKCRNAECLARCTVWKGIPMCPAGERCDNNVCVRAT